MRVYARDSRPKGSYGHLFGAIGLSPCLDYCEAFGRRLFGTF